MIAPAQPPRGGAERVVTEVFHFDGWALWPGTRRLLRHGKQVPLGGRAFDLLLVLLEQPDRLVSQDELLEKVWPGLAVEPNNLQVQIWTLRRLLGPTAIVNVARRGYRLTLPVQVLAAGSLVGPTVDTAAPYPAAEAVTLAGVHAADWPDWALPLRSPLLVTLTGADPARLRQAAEHLASLRRAGRAAALWRIALPPADSAAPLPASPDATDPLWRRLAGAPGQVLLLDCQHAPLLARQLADAARRLAPMLQLLATAQRPLGLTCEVVADLGELGDMGEQGDPTGSALRWQARRGPTRR